jgi:hypothetical protein
LALQFLSTANSDFPPSPAIIRPDWQTSPRRYLPTTHAELKLSSSFDLSATWKSFTNRLRRAGSN